MQQLGGGSGGMKSKQSSMWLKYNHGKLQPQPRQQPWPPGTTLTNIEVQQSNNDRVAVVETIDSSAKDKQSCGYTCGAVEPGTKSGAYVTPILIFSEM